MINDDDFKFQILLMRFTLVDSAGLCVELADTKPQWRNRLARGSYNQVLLS